MNRWIDCPLRTAAAAQPEAPAVITETHTLTYAELDRRADVVAARLREAGCGAGTYVALYLPADEHYLALLAALWRLGSVACPVSTRVPPGALGPFLQHRNITTQDDAGGWPAGADLLLAEVLCGPGDPGAAPPRPRVAPDRPATVVFTSGSTGAPKGAVHTLRNHYFSARGSAANIPLAAGHRWLLSLPLYHVGGLAVFFRCLLAGAAVVIPQPGRPMAEVLARHAVTHVSLVSTQLLRLLRDGAERLERLDAILLGGSALPPALLDEAFRLGLPVHTSYGLTEMASQVTATPPGADRAHLRSSGRLLPYRDLRIGADGEILVRGETLFTGYLRGAVVEPAVDVDGWFHTGDIGRLDEEGYLHVSGRRDNRFISGGENIQPEEIEQALGRLPGVTGAVVVPVPDDEFGYRPVAFVRGPEAVDGGALARALAGSLPRFKIPVAFYAWPDVEESMKVDRARLRRLAEHRKGTARAADTET